MRDDQAEPTLSYLSYETFLADVDAVARKLEADSWRPDFLVGVGRGGLVPAAFLSHRLDIPMLSVDVSSGDAGFSDELMVKLAGKTIDGRRILIIDDINDSGKTIASFRAELVAHGCVGDCVRVAVLISNLRSPAAVEYWSRTIDREQDKRWFVFPWEAQADRRTLVQEAVSVPERLA
jgi:xanthine phosphoribosyltransferase